MVDSIENMGIRSLKYVASILERDCSKNQISNTFLKDLLCSSLIFDYTYYLGKYLDIASSGIDGAKHYINYGFRENRIPSFWLQKDSFLNYIINHADKSNFVSFIIDIAQHIDELIIIVEKTSKQQAKETDNPLMINTKDQLNKYFYDVMVACRANTIMETHKRTFGKYRNSFRGKEIVLIATGSTLNDYIPLQNTIHVGVNKAFSFSKCKMDFIFLCDQGYPRLDWVDKLNNYSSVKFYGLPVSPFYHQYYNIVSEADIIKSNANIYYAIDRFYYPPIYFSNDISCEPLTAAGSVIFNAIQFICYTHPKKIYLVGCDCTSEYFDKSKSGSNYHVIQGWNAFKEFQKRVYPDIEIVSINPIGLKGMFEDYYTK